MAEAVADIGIREVRAVRHVRNVLLCKVCLDLRAGNSKQRTNQITPRRRNPGKPGNRTAPQKMEEHSFGIVLQIMGSCYDRTTESCSCLLQKSIPQSSGRFLDPDSMRVGKCCNISFSDTQRNAVFPAVIRDKSTVPLRLLSTQGVIIVSSINGNAVCFPIGKENVEKAHGIRPAGNRAEDAASRTDQAGTGDGINNRLRHGWPHKR